MSQNRRMDGNLKVADEFRKAKRNLLWFCSFTILLWLVQAPGDGMLQPPMLGNAAKIDVVLLRLIAWAGCLYCLVGFYREANNVERLNSEALYTAEFDTIGQRLRALSDQLAEHIDSFTQILESLTRVRFPSTPEFDRIASTLLADLAKATNELHQLLQAAATRPQGPAKDHAREKLLPTWDITQKGIEVAVHTNLRAISESLSDTAHSRAKLEQSILQTEMAVGAIRDLKRQFHRLSGRIRGEHRILYTWYDKYLGYMMFVLATAATAPDLLRMASPRYRHFHELTSGWLTIAIIGTGLCMFYLWLNRWVLSAGRHWEMPD